MESLHLRIDHMTLRRPNSYEKTSKALEPDLFLVPHQLNFELLY